MSLFSPSSDSSSPHATPRSVREGKQQRRGVTSLVRAAHSVTLYCRRPRWADVSVKRQPVETATNDRCSSQIINPRVERPIHANHTSHCCIHDTLCSTFSTKSIGGDGGMMTLTLVLKAFCETESTSVAQGVIVQEVICGRAGTVKQHPCRPLASLRVAREWVAVDLPRHLARPQIYRRRNYLIGGSEKCCATVCGEHLHTPRVDVSTLALRQGSKRQQQAKTSLVSGPCLMLDMSSDTGPHPGKPSTTDRTAAGPDDGTVAK